MTTITRQNAAAFRRPLYRPDPVGPASAYKTYSIVAPLDSHWRPATCEEIGCLAHHNGFRTAVDEATVLGQRQAEYIRQRAARPFSEAREGHLTVFEFPPGTPCFTQHQTRRSRPPLYIVRPGDWRGSGSARALRADQWVDDFRSHQERLEKVRG